ncbi:hypothetical protein GWK47_024234 [Chionoecetes opilio]|uniref:Uncharacterized protein n=1 Tax=Chionoecetes opilio TaxID=41210 RepID=A0A8J4XLT1_CHIOP|nr:hypothetical protein GWK47_024234 [Chionoecetes opilio]
MPEIIDVKYDVLRFIEQQLDKQQQRDDYRKMLIFARAFLGGGVTAPFRYPGPIHHARWMAKVIYSFKVWLFRRQFRLTVREEPGLRDICVFVVRLYLKAWFTAPLAAAAPNSDLELMKALAAYPNRVIGKAARAKLAKHLWYLSEDLVGLALFDRAVLFATKALMVSAMEVEADGSEDDRQIPRAQVEFASVIGKTVADFATANSRCIFERLNLPSGFLDVAPEEWEDREDFRKAAETVQCLHVVNDHAERGVALIQKFSGSITHDEKQLQFLVRVVDDHRRRYPDALKRTVAGQ